MIHLELVNEDYNNAYYNVTLVGRNSREDNGKIDYAQTIYGFY